MVLGGGNTDLQRLWVPSVMVAMAMLWWFVGDGFAVVVGCYVRRLLAVGCGGCWVLLYQWWWLARLLS